MTPTDLREALDHLGLSQAGAARRLGYNPRTMRRWCETSGKYPVPHQASMIINLLLKEKK